MLDKKTHLNLNRGHWYGWQMLPGYGVNYSPYFSPIFVTEVVPLKSGKNVLKLEFLNAHYAQGVADFELDLKVLKKEAHYIIAELVYGNFHNDRAAIISTINEEWLESFAPLVLKNHRNHKSCKPKENIQRFLDECYLPRSMWR